jgi:hypothetical protein
VSPPVGQLTRGTTGHNRLRRSDRWLVHSPRVRTALQAAADPLVVDLGYGELPVTTLELAARLKPVRAGIRVVGLEIHPDRVHAARAAAPNTVEFGLGGFELGGLRPVLVRAFNVLRQYPAEAVPDAWSSMRTRLAPGGPIIDGTCDELGRRCAWVLLAAADRAWASVAGHGVFGPRERWRAMLLLLHDQGLPVEPPRRRMRDGVLTVPWVTVAPVAGGQE